MQLIKGFLIIVWFLVIPYLVGLLFTRRMTREKNSIQMALLCGYITIFALFEILSLPLIFAKAPFHILYLFFVMALILLVVYSLIINRKAWKEIISFQVQNSREINWAMVLAVFLILSQALLYVYFRMSDNDDAFYVTTATTTLYADSMFQINTYTGEIAVSLPTRYVLSPFPIFLATASKFVDMHPAAVAHTVMPAFFVPISYMVYGMIGRWLFKGNKKNTGVFLCLLSFIQIFSYYSFYTQGTFLLTRIWQGKAFLAAVFLPALFYLCIRVFVKNAARIDWILLAFMMTACCLPSSMGIMLAPVMTGIFALLYGLGRHWKKIFQAVLCCLPCLICACIYLLMQ